MLQKRRTIWTKELLEDRSRNKEVPLEYITKYNPHLKKKLKKGPDQRMGQDKQKQLTRTVSEPTYNRVPTQLKQ